MKRLTMHIDGVTGISLGVMGELEYALDFVPEGLVACNIYQRSADQEGTYGGWRFAFASSHPKAFKSLPYMLELAERVETAIADRKFDLLVAKPYAGNHHSDSALLTELTEYYMDFRNPEDNRIAAVRRVDVIMGISQPNVTDADILESAVIAVKDMCGEDGQRMFPHAYITGV